MRRTTSAAFLFVIGGALLAPAAQALEVTNRFAWGGTHSTTTTNVDATRTVKSDGYTSYYDRISGTTKDGYDKYVVNQGRESFWTNETAHIDSTTVSTTKIHFDEVGFRTSY